MTCQCKQAGWCQVFQRQMNPRDFATCQREDEKGRKCREAWKVTEKPPEKPQEAIKEVPPPEQPEIVPAPPGVKKVLLVNNLCAGDVLVSTAAIESLASQYPDRFWIGMNAKNNQPIYENNPLIHPLRKDDPEVQVVEWHYPLIGQSNQRPVSFLDAYTASLADILGVPLFTSVNRPYLYLTDQEKGWASQVEEITKRKTKYWIVNAGWKNCFTTKGWLPEHYQAVVDHFRGSIQFVQIGQSKHNHKRLEGVIDLIDKTDLRQLIRLSWNAQGAIGPSTFLQHLMAAHQKPYVLIDAAREPASWMNYPNQTSLVQHGKLACCATASCWKSRVVPLNDGKDGSMCLQPAFGGSVPIPRCSAMIQPSDVIRAIEGYYKGGRLEY